jgi:hypothetical protein
MPEETKAEFKFLDNKFIVTTVGLVKACSNKELRFYLYLKGYAINKHSSFPSFETIEQDLGDGWGREAIRALTKEMVEKGRLKYVPGSGRKSSLYDFTWYDKFNEDMRHQNFKGSQKRIKLVETPDFQGVRHLRNLDGTISNITNNTLITNAETAWSYPEYLKKLKESSNKGIHIIALYLDFKGFILENEEQVKSAIKRSLRPANNLVGYSDERILETMEFLMYDPAFKWTLETVEKYIDEDLSSLEPMKIKRQKITSRY